MSKATLGLEEVLHFTLIDVSHNSLHCQTWQQHKWLIALILLVWYRISITRSVGFFCSFLFLGFFFVIIMLQPLWHVESLCTKFLTCQRAQLSCLPTSAVMHSEICSVSRKNQNKQQCLLHNG